MWIVPRRSRNPSLEAIRICERETISAARLSPADEDAIAAPPAPSEDVLDEEPHEILEVAPDAPDEVVRAAFKAQVRDLNGHPDTGGSTARFRKLEKAREAMLDK